MPADAKYALTWDLDALLPHPERNEFNSLFETFRTDLQRVAERSDNLPPVDDAGERVSTWSAFLTDWQSIDARATDLNAFIGCHAAADAENKLFQKFEGRAAALRPLRERIAANVEYALRDASDADFATFLKADDSLQQLEFFLRERREYAKLRLPRDQERLASELAVDGLHAWGRLYDRISGALKIRVMERGEIVEKSPGQVMLDSPQRSVRQNNFYAADKAWNSIADTCADALNHISGWRLAVYDRLGVEDHLDVPLQMNRMTRGTLETMWSVISERKDCLLKYMHRKASMMGLEKPTWYDVTAPLPVSAGDPDKLPYDDACDLVIRTFKGFSPDLGEFANRALDERWIEVENRSGKRQGGFCTGFPTKQQSRIFMTYTDSADSMSTLAHELGHAYHSHVLRERPVFLQEYPMNLAETASTFAEAVLGEQRIEETNSRSEQLEILDVMLGDAVAFLMNIHARFLFEDAFHRERAKGELTADRFSELMTEAQHTAYLNGLAEDGWNPRFWASKLHFYISEYPFYNFPYTFGYLLSLGVYALSKETDDGGFPARYRELLIATGCMNAEEAVESTMGYDLRRAEFWNRSLDIVESRVNRFIELSE